MDPSSAQHHHREIANSQTLESITLVCAKPRPPQPQPQQQQENKKPRPPASEQALKCPRCDSTSTKFCYYNNYSLSQPRYFCKSCRRYWTKGGTLRNVPVGGGCRRNNKRPSSTSSTSSTATNTSSAVTSSPSSSSSLLKMRSQDNYSFANNSLLASLITTPTLTYDDANGGDDHLALAFARLQKQSVGQMGFGNDHFPTLGSLENLGFASFDHHHHHHHHGFLESNNNNGGSHSLYYGASVNGGGGAAAGEEMAAMLPYEDQTMKQEVCSNVKESESSRVLWGFPWQINGGDAALGDHHHHHHLDSSSGRQQSWSGLGSSTWHGLINSPLM